MPVEESDLSLPARLRYRVGNVALRGLIGLSMLVPYRWRIPGTAWITARTLARLAGFHKRIRDNLALVCPDLPAQDVSRLCIAVSDNAVRTTMEHFSTTPFLAKAHNATTEGPGWDAVEKAQAEGRPVIICSGHFGNFAMIRACFRAKGSQIGVLYRRLANPYFNRWYTGKLADLGEPCFEQGRRGMMQLVKHLRGGGMLGILTDLHAHHGAPLTFFGKTAHSSVITAELAVKYNALLVPGYAIRKPDGLNFHVVLHDPIPHSDPATMTQAMNDDLEAMVRAHMDQWFWIHRRWKPWIH